MSFLFIHLDNFHLSDDSRTLTINDPQKSDAGLYECSSASSPTTQSHSKIKLTVIQPPNSVKILEKNQSPSKNSARIIENKQNLLNNQPQIAQLTCKISGAWPTPNVRWVNNFTGDEIINTDIERRKDLTNDLVEVTSTVHLNLNSDNIRDQTDLACIVEFVSRDPHKIIWSHSENVSIDLISLPRINKFELIETNTNNIQEGDPLKFRCLGNSNPPVEKYRFYVGDQMIGVSEDRNGILISTATKDMNDNKIFCEGFTELAGAGLQQSLSATEGSKFTVKYSPILVKKSPRIISNPSSEVNLICKYDGLPKAEVSWYFSQRKQKDETTNRNLPSDFDDNFSLKNVRKSSQQAISTYVGSGEVLRLSSVNEDHTGWYSCQADNGIYLKNNETQNNNMVENKIALTVTGRPRIGPITVKEASNQYLHLTCDYLSSPSPSKYQVECLDSKYSIEQILSKYPHLLPKRIERYTWLIPNTSEKCRCQVSNDYGYDQFDWVNEMEISSSRFLSKGFFNNLSRPATLIILILALVFTGFILIVTIFIYFWRNKRSSRNDSANTTTSFLRGDEKRYSLRANNVTSPEKHQGSESSRSNQIILNHNNEARNAQQVTKNQVQNLSNNSIQKIDVQNIPNYANTKRYIEQLSSNNIRENSSQNNVENINNNGSSSGISSYVLCQGNETSNLVVKDNNNDKEDSEANSLLNENHLENLNIVNFEQLQQNKLNHQQTDNSNKSSPKIRSDMSKDIQISGNSNNNSNSHGESTSGFVTTGAQNYSSNTSSDNDKNFLNSPSFIKNSQSTAFPITKNSQLQTITSSYSAGNSASPRNIFPINHQSSPIIKKRIDLASGQGKNLSSPAHLLQRHILNLQNSKNSNNQPNFQHILRQTHSVDKTASPNFQNSDNSHNNPRFISNKVLLSNLQNQINSGTLTKKKNILSCNTGQSIESPSNCRLPGTGQPSYTPNSIIQNVVMPPEFDTSFISNRHNNDGTITRSRKGMFKPVKQVKSVSMI